MRQLQELTAESTALRMIEEAGLFPMDDFGWDKLHTPLQDTFIRLSEFENLNIDYVKIIPNFIDRGRFRQ